MARSKKAPGNLKRRPRGWYWRVCCGGKYHNETIYAAERQDAEQIARGKYDDLLRQRGREADGVAVGQRMSDAVDYFERERLPLLAPGTQGAYKDSLKPIKSYFVTQIGDPRLDRIRPVHIGDFLNWRRMHRLDGTAPLHLRTLAKDRTVLHAVLEVAREREWIQGNPVTKSSRVPKADKRAPVILDAKQYERLFAEAHDPQVRFYLLVLGETGARDESEALWLTWSDFDLNGGYLTIATGRNGHRTKGGRSRIVPMTPRLKEAAQDYFAAYRFAKYDGIRPEFLFHHTTTRRHYRAGERVHSYRGTVATIATHAKLPEGWHMHDLRHRRVTTWLAEGKSPVLVMKAMGHSDLRVTMSYYSFVPEHLRALVDEPGQAVGQMQDIAGA
ncbi:MAG: site-specific integrase [Gemmatimonadales bacterium]|jgi:integrase